ncbi:unnamed protein product, partial [Iphiclides podalirius]
MPVESNSAKLGNLLTPDSSPLYNVVRLLSRLNIVTPTPRKRRKRCVRLAQSHLPPRRLNTRQDSNKMSRVGRGRRTRVYDCNYNKGESYYRPVLDRLDGKVPVAKEPDRDSIRADVDSRIKSALDEMQAPVDELFDSRGARAQRGRPLSSAFEENDLSDEITESLKRLRASKKTSRFSDDIDFENSVSNLENRMRISDKILESVGIALKGVDEESAAAQRAKATRARLTDLEDEMSELSERTAAREKRAARLRALVADTDSTDTTVAASKITIRAEREKKQVTF